MTHGDYEPVYTVWDYFDQPRRGVAAYSRIPHYYERLFDEVADAFSDIYVLAPLDEPTARLALEAWECWIEFRQKRRHNVSAQPPSGAFANWLESQNLFRQQLCARMFSGTEQVVFAIPDFRVVSGGTTTLGPFFAHWRKVAIPSGLCLP